MKGARKGAKKGKSRRKGGYRPPRSVPDMASCTESIALTNITGLPYNMNQMFGWNGLQLQYFIERAVPIAQAYQHYRIKKVTLEFKPQYDTFTPAVGPAGTGVLAPNLYYMINKSGSIPTTVSLDNLKAMGAKPIRFDEQIRRVSWRPSVLQENSGVLGDVGSGYKISPWLSTNANANAPGIWQPSTVNHLGIYWFVQRPGILPAGMAELSYDVQLTVEFEFKKPLVKTASSNTPALEFSPEAMVRFNLPQLTTTIH